MDEFTTKPSLNLSFLFFLSYLLAVIPLTIGITYGLVFIGYTADNLKTNLSEIIMMAQIGITSILTFLLARRYLAYLLSERWKKNYLLYLTVGLRWSFPLLLLYAFSMLIPIIRRNLISGYLSTDIITVKDASNFTLILFSVWLVLGAIFEEFFFRGIIVQKLQEVTNSTISVLISAGLFALSHFIFFPISIGNLSISFLVGVLSGFAYTSTGSCISAILPHLLNNVICAWFVWVIR